MAADRWAIFACALAWGCGRFGFDSAADTDDDAPGGVAIIDQHLRAAPGWSISPLIDLTGVVEYNGSDFTDGKVTPTVHGNEPRYVAALYEPFAAQLAVIAGRSVIEIPAEGRPVVHAYRPPKPDDRGPDVPGRMTFADLGPGNVGLWLTSASVEGGDGLYLIGSDWSILRLGEANNSYAITLDPTDRYGGTGVPTLYVSSRTDGIQPRTQTGPGASFSPPGVVDELAVVGNQLFATVETTGEMILDRIGPPSGRQVSELSREPSNLTLAEGATEGGLYAIHGDAELVSISPGDGSFTRLAWSNDPAWVWHAVCVPRGKHPLAGHLVVLESNRASNHDRLLLITPAAP